MRARERAKDQRMRLFTTQRSAQASRAEQPVGVRLIILEEGAFAFEPPKPSTEAALEVAVIVQTVGEDPAQLEARVIRRLTQLEQADRAVIEAVIAAGAVGGRAILETRERVARTIQAHMTKNGSGEIALAAGSDARPELRHELMELAGTLTHGANHPNVGLRVLFGSHKTDPERRSGIHSAIETSPRERNSLAELTG